MVLSISFFTLNHLNYSVCGQLSFEGSSGTFSSPNYPASYNRDNLDCRYVIDVSAVVNSSRILLTFSDFATEAGYDYVEVSINNQDILLHNMGLNTIILLLM